MAIGGALASLAGGMMQSKAAKDAANSQERAAQAQLDLQRDMYETTRGDLAPFRQGGGNALAAYLYEMGLGDAPLIGGTPLEIETISGGTGRGGLGGDMFGGVNSIGGGGSAPDRYRVGDQIFNTMEEAQAYANANRSGATQYQGITLSPAAQYAMQQGFQGVEASAAARGGLRSGSTLQALEQTRFGLAAQDRDSQMNRLAGLTDMGMGAAGMNASNANAFASMGSNSLANMGNAQAAGYIGAGNAWSNALGQLAGTFGYQKMLQ